MTAGYTKKGGWVWMKVREDWETKGVMKLCYRKYRIVCILNNCPFGKGKFKKYIYSEQRFDRLVEDGRLGCTAELSLVLWRVFLGRYVVVVRLVVERIRCSTLSFRRDSPSLPRPCTSTAAADNSTARMYHFFSEQEFKVHTKLQCHKLMLVSDWYSRNSSLQRVDCHLHVEICTF